MKSTRLDRVVQTLVDFMRARELHLEEVDARRLLEDVALLAAPEAETHGVTIRRLMPEDPLLIRVDLDMMKQALLNVVINGVQAMPEGGVLSISAYRSDDAMVAEISDQGVGIDPELHEKVFELYFTTQNGMGTESVWRKLIRSSIGITVLWNLSQREARETTFRFRLPLIAPRLLAADSEKSLGPYIFEAADLMLVGTLPDVESGAYQNRFDSVTPDRVSELNVLD